MEFKKPNRHNKVQPGRSASRPIDTNFITPRSRPRPAPPLVTTSAQAADISKAAPVKVSQSNARPSNHSSFKNATIAYIRSIRLTKKTIIVSGVILIIIVGIIIASISQQVSNNSNNNENSKEVVQDLEYQTILPEGKSISDLGGWRRVSPSKADPVYAYTDTIGANSINVSEQPLPDSFIGDTDDQVAELAKKFNATTKIQAGDIKVHLGSSSKGPQSVIFTKNSLLILIKSQEKIEDAAWIKYIKSLN